MTFRVELLAAAHPDAAELYERITEAAPIHGPIWYKRRSTAIESLQQSPPRRAFAPENDRVSIEVRLLPAAGPLLNRVPTSVQAGLPLPHRQRCVMTGYSKAGGGARPFTFAIKVSKVRARVSCVPTSRAMFWIGASL